MEINLEEALACLNDSNSIVRYKMCSIVGREQIPVPNEEVMARLNDTDPLVRAEACFMANALKTDVPIEKIVDLFLDPSGAVRKAALSYFRDRPEISNYVAVKLLFEAKLNELRDWL